MKRVKYAGAPDRPDNHKKPQIANYSNLQTEECFSVDMVKDWFANALGKDAQKPSDAACKQLARDLQVAINRIGNLEKRKVGRDDLKDDDPKEWFREKMDPLADAAHNFITAAWTFEKTFGNYIWEDERGSIALWDVIETMQQIVKLRRHGAEVVDQWQASRGLACGGAGNFPTHRSRDARSWTFSQLKRDRRKEPGLKDWRGGHQSGLRFGEDFFAISDDFGLIEVTTARAYHYVRGFCDSYGRSRPQQGESRFDVELRKHIPVSAKCAK